MEAEGGENAGGTGTQPAACPRCPGESEGSLMWCSGKYQQHDTNLHPF